MADRAYQRAAAYAAERVQGSVEGRPRGSPIAEHPDVRRLLLSMRSTVSAMRAFQLQVAVWPDVAGAQPDAEAFSLAEFFVPVLTGWLTENSVQIANDGIPVHGGTGFIEETGAAQYLRDARILPIDEGTTAIQANDLTRRKLVRDNRATGQAASDGSGWVVTSYRDARALLADPRLSADRTKAVNLMRRGRASRAAHRRGGSSPWTRPSTLAIAGLRPRIEQIVAEQLDPGW